MGMAGAGPVAERVLRLGRCRHREQLPGKRDIGLTAGAGEQAVVTDTVEALRQHMEQEATDELVGAERHGALVVDTVASIVLVAEGDAGLVEREYASAEGRLVLNGTPVTPSACA